MQLTLFIEIMSGKLKDARTASAQERNSIQESKSSLKVDVEDPFDVNPKQVDSNYIHSYIEEEKRIDKQIANAIKHKWFYDWLKVTQSRATKEKMSVDRAAKAVSRFLELYRIGMQGLLQGYREVTSSENFKFEDGSTVEDKVKKFEDRMKH